MGNDRPRPHGKLQPLECDRHRPSGLLPPLSLGIGSGDKPFPGRDKHKPDPLQLGGWYWESGFDHDPLDKVEYIRDWNFRAMYGAWDAIKNADHALPNYKLNWAAYVEGKRESRRLWATWCSPSKI